MATSPHGWHLYIHHYQVDAALLLALDGLEAVGDQFPLAISLFKQFASQQMVHHVVFSHQSMQPRQRAGFHCYRHCELTWRVFRVFKDGAKVECTAAAGRVSDFCFSALHADQQPAIGLTNPGPAKTPFGGPIGLADGRKN
jgi:hypothetical protein